MFLLACAWQDGLEMTWAVNVAAPFLLTGELLPLISERIINVTSISLADSIDFDNLQQVSATIDQEWLMVVGTSLSEALGFSYGGRTHLELHRTGTSDGKQVFLAWHSVAAYAGGHPSLVNPEALVSQKETTRWEMQEKGYGRGGHAAYGLSKLAINMLTYKLARKMELTSVTVNAIDPGTVNTKLCYAGWGPVSHVAMRVEVRCSAPSSVANTSTAPFLVK